MNIVVRVTTIGPAGANVYCGLEFVVTPIGSSGGADLMLDPNWTEAETETAMAEAVRNAVRAQGLTVDDDTPVMLLGGVSKV